MAVAGPHEQRARSLMSGADACSAATYVAVIEIARALDENAHALDEVMSEVRNLRGRLDRLEGPRPPVARVDTDQYRMDDAIESALRDGVTR